MRYSYTLIAFAATALALPTGKPADDGSWQPGMFEMDRHFQILTK
jgi:hypothetical protein